MNTPDVWLRTSFAEEIDNIHEVFEWMKTTKSTSYVITCKTLAAAANLFSVLKPFRVDPEATAVSFRYRLKRFNSGRTQVLVVTKELALQGYSITRDHPVAFASTYAMSNNEKCQFLGRVRRYDKADSAQLLEDPPEFFIKSKEEATSTSSEAKLAKETFRASIMFDLLQEALNHLDVSENEDHRKMAIRIDAFVNENAKPWPRGRALKPVDLE